MQACALPEMGIWSISRSLTAVTAGVGGCNSRTIFCPLLQAWSPTDGNDQGDWHGSRAVDRVNKAVVLPFWILYGLQAGTVLHARLDDVSWVPRRLQGDREDTAL